MRILFIRKKYNPYGGAENYLKTLLNFLLEEKHEIFVGASQWEKQKGVKYIHLPVLKTFSSLAIWSFDRSAHKAVKRLAPHCTVSFERTTCQDIYRAGDGCHKTYLTLRKHYEPFVKGRSFAFNPLHRLILAQERQIFRQTPVIVANSTMVYKDILNYYPFCQKKIKVMLNGVDVKRFSPQVKEKYRKAARKELGISEGAKLILFAGSDFKRKGLLQLIKAMPLLSPKITLLVIGRDKEDKYKKIAQELKVANRIIFAGPARKIERFYGASDLFVLPTLYDPFSNACLEAMACGLPVVTTKTNGVSEILRDGENGFSFSLAITSSDLANIINRCLANSREMGKKAAQIARRHSMAEAAANFMKLIKKVANERNKITSSRHKKY